MADTPVSGLPPVTETTDQDKMIINSLLSGTETTSHITIENLKGQVGGAPEGGGAGKPVLFQMNANGRERNDHGSWSAVTGGKKQPFRWFSESKQVSVPTDSVGCILMFHVNNVAQVSQDASQNPYFNKVGYDWNFKSYLNVSFRVPGVQFITQNNNLEGTIKAETNGVSIRNNVSHNIGNDKATYVAEASNMSKFTYFTYPEGTDKLTFNLTVDVQRTGWTKTSLRAIRFMLIPFTDTEAVSGFMGNIEENDDDWVTDYDEVSGDDGPIIQANARATLKLVQDNITGYLNENPSDPEGVNSELATIRSNIYTLRSTATHNYVVKDANGEYLDVWLTNPNDPDDVYRNPAFGVDGPTETLQNELDSWYVAEAFYTRTAALIGFTWDFSPYGGGVYKGL